jgi:drug/metabolite transporter (DMT)-like permease
MLFARPFGPRAAAALAPEDAEAEVYGVSHEDRDRMRRLLDAAAESSRDGRRAVAVGLGVGGLLFGGMGTVMLTLPAAHEDRPFQHAFGGGALAIGGLALGGSAIALLTTTKMEDMRDGFVRALDANPREFDRAVREAEREVLARAAAAKRARTVAGYAMSGVGVAALGLGIAGELSAEEPGARLLSRFGIVAGVGYALGGVGVLSLRSEEERLADLWANDPATRQVRPTGGLRLRPLFGLGTVGVAGTF